MKGRSWWLFKAWVTKRLRDVPNGLRDVTLIYPALREREINWDACLNSLRQTNLRGALCLHRLRILVLLSSVV